MAEIGLSKEGFGLKLYDRFPPRYREDDIDTNYSLRRYLEATAEGGFNYTIDEWNGILNFADPDKATPQVLPLLFKQFGLSVFNGIPEVFLRYLLPRLGTAWSKKGGLDVIEFVSSSISGVKTTTVVHPLPNGEVDVDVRLEMDFSLGDYLPDQKQFIRILSQFTPFYLDLRIIYVYRYHDRIYITGEDAPYIDHVVHTVNDLGCITYDGCIEDPVMFPANKVLNVDFILNHRKPAFPVPDVFFDSVTYRTNETGSINSRWSPVNPRYNTYYYGFLNMFDFRSNLNAFYNGVYVDTDQHTDHIRYIPVLDLGDLRGTDTRKDRVKFSHNESGVFSPDLNVFDRHITTYHDKSVLRDEDTFIDNTVKLVEKETAPLNSEDSRLDHVCIGVHPLFFYMLNTDFTLNEGLVTNDSNVDEYCEVCPEEADDSVVSYTLSETGVFDLDDDWCSDGLETLDEDAAEFSEEDTEHLYVTIGDVVCMLPALNVDTITLNTGLETNYSSVDDGVMCAEDTTVSVNVSSEVSETVGLTVVISPVLGVLTNTTTCVLNDCGFSVLDGYDIVSQGGTKTIVFF